MFFRSFSSYAEWYKHRRCTFLHFKVLSVKPLYVNTLILKWLIKREQCRWTLCSSDWSGNLNFVHSGEEDISSRCLCSRGNDLAWYSCCFYPDIVGFPIHGGKEVYQCLFCGGARQLFITIKFHFEDQQQQGEKKKAKGKSKINACGLWHWSVSSKGLHLSLLKVRQHVFGLQHFQFWNVWLEQEINHSSLWTGK